MKRSDEIRNCGGDAGQTERIGKKIMRQTRPTNPNEAVRPINSGEWVVVKQVSSCLKEDGVVTYRGSAEVEITKPRQPRQFFTDRKDLWVSPNFQSLIVSAKTVAVGTKFRLNHFEITKQGGATDAENEKALAIKGNHLFEVDILAAIIAELISAQEGGKEGVLLNNGYANFFYTSSLVVSVTWSADAGKWFVYAYRRDVSWWGRGSRVFVPGN